MSMNKTWVLLLLLVIVIITGIAVPFIRQSTLNSQLLHAISFGATAGEVRDLIHRGADPNAGEASVYNTALDRAIAGTDSDTIRVLLDAGASVKPQGQAHTSPAILLACYNGPRGGLPDSNGYRILFTELRSHGASLEEKDSLGFTPLMRAVWSGNVAATKALLALGANPRARNNLGYMALDMTAQSGGEEQIQIDNLLHAYRQAHPVSHVKH